VTQPLFRPEAVAHHEASRARRTDVRLRERATARAYRALVAGVFVALVAAYAVRADETARGPATVAEGGRTAVVLLPVGALHRLEVGETGRLHGVRIVITVVHPVRVEAGEAVVPVTVSLAEPVPSGPTTATISLRRSRIVELVTRRG
jgi:hypothetical protein